MEVKYDVSFVDGRPDYTFSLQKQAYVIFNGRKAYLAGPKNLAVVPGDFDAVERFAPELTPIFKALWTEEVIAAWQANAAADGA